MGKAKSANEFAEKWRENIVKSVEDIAKAVSETTVSPGEETLKARKKWEKRVSAPETADKWAERVGNISLEEWKRAFVEKAVPHIVEGADRKKQNVVDFAEALLEYQAKGKAILDTMPSFTPEERTARLVFWNNYMRNFKYKRK